MAFMLSKLFHPHKKDMKIDSSLGSDPFRSVDPLIELDVDGNWRYPNGSWAVPSMLDYQALCKKRRPFKAHDYTLNGSQQVGHLSGREQVIGLKPLFCTSKNSHAFVVQWAINKGYALPDLRAEMYIRHNRKKAESLNPKLFRRLDRRKKQEGYNELWLHFAGSTFRNDDGIACLPCLQWCEGITFCNNHQLCSTWDDLDVLLVLET